ncbi:MAG: Fe-S oxidoreductase [Coriobacteriia bacterium]|nr:Fe-S oxidoreductase [Coriobacteriia bacterium]
MKCLLVQPAFPIPNKSLNHKSFLPVGLLKVSTWLRRQEAEVELAVGCSMPSFEPDEIYITSLFTYWSSYVWDCVRFYRRSYPAAKIIVGGIYASLAPEHCLQSGCDEVHVGLHEQAEQCPPDYDLVETDFQILHASRGCVRRCAFCGTYRIEPEYTYKRTITSEIEKRHLVFYDNNLLANPHIKQLLTELRDFRLEKRVVTAECQSGFDGRLLTPELACLLKAARFRNPRIAWDGPVEEESEVRKQIQILTEAGYAAKDISVFMIFNHELPPGDLRHKAEACFHWGVQVADCRFRPLDCFSDGYKPQAKQQEPDEYYLYDVWTDEDVRAFRRLVRENNICLRYRIPRDRYSKQLEGLSGIERARMRRKLGLEDGTQRLTREQLDELNRMWIAEALERAM